MTIAKSNVFTERGLAAMPRSILLASSYGRQIPTLSPCLTLWTGFLNICIDLIFLSYFRAGSSIVSPIWAAPARTVPVTIVPFPFNWKQWSMAKRKSFYAPRLRSGMSTWLRIAVIRSSMPSVKSYPAPSSEADALKADTGTIWVCGPNFDLDICAFSVYICLLSLAGSPLSRSTLLNATISLSMSISPRTMHSKVWV